MQSNEVKWLPLKSLQPNTGQVPGLPGNPRQWTEGDVKRIARSLKETPELFVARPIIVLPYSTPGADDCYVILGGNLRSEGARRNKMQTVPCYILPTETPVAKLKEIVIKDNGSFGAWDYDSLGNEWSDLPLPEWGVPAWDVEDKKPEAKEDNFDEDQGEIHIRCKKGDIWQLGEHRLVCGDSTDLDTVKSLMGGGLG